jgi:hypothetical protein
MNAENPVQIDLFGVSATGTKDTRLAEHIGGEARRRFRGRITEGDRLLGRHSDDSGRPPACRTRPIASARLPRRNSMGSPGTHVECVDRR